MAAVETTVREIAPIAQQTAAVTPPALLAMAVQQGADLDKLERLMALQERWEKAEAARAYNAAFAAFKAEAVTIIKGKRVTDGPLKGKSYAELHDIVNAVTPALSTHGLSASWQITKDEQNWLEVTCTLKHVDGHMESVAMGGPPDTGGAKNAIQARASAVTYLQRYTLKAITGLSDQDDDDDGRGGARRPATTTPAQVAADELLTDSLLEAAGEAASKGTAAYTDFWTKRLTKGERLALAGYHASFKAKAQAADKEQA